MSEREVMSCGHLLSSVVTADEGTSYCAEVAALKRSGTFHNGRF